MAKDKIHDAVRRALEKDGWTITDDPLFLLPKEDKLAVDLGAEKLIIAERGVEKIAVEIKSFEHPSLMYEFHRAIGQYFNYETALLETKEDRELFVAIPDAVYDQLIGKLTIRKSIERMNMKLLIIDIDLEEIVKWIK